MKEKLLGLWNQIYDGKHADMFGKVMDCLNNEKEIALSNKKEKNETWYKEAVIYSLYVDLYSGDFDGLTEKLGYIKELGANVLWLLPLLDSPMRDQGFDIKDYYSVRPDLGGNESFLNFIEEAHKNGIRIIFDMALNHTSDQHEWFRKAVEDKDSKYRDYYIWSDTDEKYAGVRLLFKGMVDSNWEWSEEAGEYFYHRFYGFQPDLNYRNPEVVFEVLKAMLYWKGKGIDGLRLDAIPFIWKEEGTSCENLPQTHSIIKFFRHALDYVSTGMLLLAEANMTPKDVVEYFGDGDECHAAYHFPVMPKFYLAQAEGDYTYIKETLSEEVTPKVPKGCQWLSFLRLHDELTLEFVTPEEKDKMNNHYLKGSQYGFRVDEGISGRIFGMFEGDTDKILNMYSMLFSTIGSPIIYYGDEVGMKNDEEFYYSNIKQTGFPDSRFFNRGKMDWKRAQNAIFNKNSAEGKIYYGLKSIIAARKEVKRFFEAEMKIVESADKALFITERVVDGEKLTIIQNLSNENKTVYNGAGVNVLTGEELKDSLELKAYEYIWSVEVLSDK